MLEALENKQIKSLEPLNNARAVMYPKIFSKYKFNLDDIDNKPKIDDFREALQSIVALPDEEFEDSRNQSDIRTARRDIYNTIKQPNFVKEAQ